MATGAGSTMDGMYSKLIDNDSPYFDESELSSPDVNHSVSMSQGRLVEVEIGGRAHWNGWNGMSSFDPMHYNEAVLRCLPPPASTVSPPPMRVVPRQTGPGPYRLATACLAMLCVILFLSVIAVSAHYKNLYQGLGQPPGPVAQNQTEGQVQMQKQPVNITVLTAALSQLEAEKASLMEERDQLLVRLAKAEAAPPPPVATSPPPPTCPQDWLLFNSSCYFISTRSKSWPDSQAYCVEKGGHLAIIHSAEEQTFLWELLPRGHWNAYWFGISDKTSEADWLWVDGTTLVGGFWEEGEPNNHIDEDCGYIVKTRKLERKAISSWYDAPCTMYWPFICEREIVPSPS